MLSNQLTTVEDLIQFKHDILREIKQVIASVSTTPVKRWLKSFEVKDLLHISTGTLHNLRTNGVILFSKIGGVVFYDFLAVERLLEDNITFQKTTKSNKQRR